jgi:8-oxo-dGTP pyrophosphatase MutT (NUDIX family)
MNLFDSLVRAADLPAPEDILEGDAAFAAAPSAEAAVLVAITDRPSPGVILTLRRPDLRRHAGQIAFPGGRVDFGEDARAAALREADEEIGLKSEAVRIAGLLDSYVTITGYHVTPVLSLVPPELPLSPHEAEVAEIFEAPIDHLLDPKNHVQRTLLFEGQQRSYYEIMWEERRIWGATAAMIVNLSKRLNFR